MLVMTWEDMFAHKLVAVLERAKTANRDVYDIWHFLKNRFKIHVKKCTEFIESLGDRGILSGLGDLLDAKQKIWAKTHLRKDTVFLLKARWDQEQ
jgi:predicted nucleotidyltransferase component of viral defense system